MRDAATGAELQRRTIAPAPSDTEGTVYDGWTLFAAQVPDVDGDGVDELVLSSVNGAVYLHDGATLEALWSRRLEPEGLPGGEAHHAGPVIFVPETDDSPAFLAVAQSNYVRSEGKVFALDLDGTIVGEIAMHGDAHAIALRKDGARVGVAIAAGLGVEAVEAVRAK